MASKHTVVLLLLASLSGCFARSAQEGRAETGPGPQELAPPSQLALMMRAMAVHADSAKAAIGRGDALPPYPKAFKGLLKAEPTAGMHIDAITFPTFSKDYQAKLDALYRARKNDRRSAYNALVQSCANCHGSHCPGPLMRIKKMYVRNEDATPAP